MESLESSSNFHNNSLPKDKYFHTRFMGLTLEDLLKEYFDIQCIVQGRLKATNYFNEKHANTSLPNQLVYLLSGGYSSSRASIPCPRCCSHLDDTSPSNQDQEMAEVTVDTEVLAQTLLENRDEITGTTNIMDNRFETTITSSSISHTESDGIDNRLNKNNEQADVNDTRQVERSIEIGVQNPADVQPGQINNEVVVLDAPLDRCIVYGGCPFVTALIQNSLYIDNVGFLIPTNVQKNPNCPTDMNITEQDAAIIEAALKSLIEIGDSSTEGEDVQKTSVIIESDSKSVEKPSEQVTLEETKEQAEDTLNKTILSPSKLNANKRNLLETKDDTKIKYITPESAKENMSHPIKANRNILPILETLKDYVPKTPGIETPMALNVSFMSSIMTPFSSMLQANLNGIDIYQLSTPDIAFTPNFTQLTPIIDAVSPFSNRLTDYFRFSFCCQLSDNEQNRSLEAHLMEMEKKSVGERNETETSSGVDRTEKSNDTVIFNKTDAVSHVQKHYCLRPRNAKGRFVKEPGPSKDIAKIENKRNPKSVRKGVKIKHIEEKECDGQTEKSSKPKTDLNKKK